MTLYELIQSDPQSAALAAAGRDRECAERVSQIVDPVQRPVQNKDVKRHAVLAGYWAGVVLAAESSAVDSVRRLAIAVHAWISDTDATTDFALTEVQQMLSGMVTAGLMTEAQKISLVQLSYARPTITTDDVSSTMAAHRPDGRI